MYYVTSHYASSPRDGTFLVMLPAQLMFRVTIPTILYSRNKDFVCHNRGTPSYWPGSFLSLQEVAHNLEGKGMEMQSTTTSENTSWFVSKRGLKFILDNNPKSNLLS